MESEVTLKLKHPITVLEKKHEELYFRPLLAKDLRSLPSSPKMGDLLDLVGRSANLTKPEVDALSAADAIAASKVISGFLSGGQEDESIESM